MTALYRFSTAFILALLLAAPAAPRAMAWCGWPAPTWASAMAASLAEITTMPDIASANASTTPRRPIRILAAACSNAA